MNQIWQSIQEEIEQQAQSFFEELLGSCSGSSSLLGFGIAVVYFRRRSRRKGP